MILNLTIIQEQGVYKKGLLYDLSMYKFRTSAPIVVWKCNFPASWDIMTDRPKNYPTD